MVQKTILNNMEKILVLGGKPIGSIEIVTRLKEMGLYTIVTDYLCVDKSPAKEIADEIWNISTADVDLLEIECRKNNVRYLSTGVHEFNINRMLELSERLSIPCYCTPSTWKYCDDKETFKTLCRQNNIPVATTFNLNDNNIDYPVITKPVDGSGSRGFHICNNIEELRLSYEDARSYSPTNRVLIEKFIPYNAVIIHYTMISGKCYYSGMSDKKSVIFEHTGSSVMGIQTFPSVGESVYLELYDKNVQRMFENAGFRNGPIWIESFYDGDDKFIFNEMGYRFGGSLTYYPVRYFYGINQLDLFLESSMGISSPLSAYRRNETNKNYCILPIHIKPGTIHEVQGFDTLKNIQDFYAIAQVHFVGDQIMNWGSAQQVFSYIHVLYDTFEDLNHTLNEILETLRVCNEYGENMLYTLFDIDSL